MGVLANRRARRLDDIVKAVQAGIAAPPNQSNRPEATPLAPPAAENPNPAARRTDRDMPWGEPPVGFGPGVPVSATPFDPRLPATGRALPRQTEYQVSWNVPGQGQPSVPFSVLRAFADKVDAARLCIGVRKKELASTGWSIAVKPGLVSSVAKTAGTTKAKATGLAQQRYAADIERLTDFWERPDRINGLTFSEWMWRLLEEHFVLDALAIYPHPAMDGSLHSLEVLDGATIKPLLDNRGARPQPPEPAYQQILWGFPRGEFTQSLGDTQRMTSDELIYRVRESRTWTPYGFSATEQALVAGDLYLKRQQWLRSEYSDGAIPAALMVPPEALDWTPEQIRQYETNINAELAGQTEQRMRWRLTPPGVTMEFPGDWAERYNANLDEYCVKLLCAFYDVMPTEIGFTQKGGLGGAGHQQGEQDSVARKGNRPVLEWVADMLNDVNQRYLGAPRELTFSFDLDETEDKTAATERAKTRVDTGLSTLNDERAEAGEPLYDFPEADEPFLLTPNGPVFIKGTLDVQSAARDASIAGSKNAVANPGGPAETDPEGDDDPPGGQKGGGDEPPKPDGGKGTAPPSESAGDKVTKSAAAELRAFETFKRRRIEKGAWRDFEFEAVDPAIAAELNDLAKAAVAEAGRRPFVGKAARSRESQDGYASHRALVAHFARAIARAMLTGIDPTELAQHAAHGEVRKSAVGGVPFDDAALNKVFADMVQQSYAAGLMQAKQQLGEAVDWSTWEPGYFDAAARVGGRGLATMLNDAGVSVRSVADSMMTRLGDALSLSIDQGLSVPQIADQIRGLLTSPERAEVIANTEVNRAMTQATLDGYREAGIEKVDWLLSTEPCELCQENADESPIPLGDDWANGDPPVHPNCECSLAPSGDPDDWGTTGTDESGQAVEGE